MRITENILRALASIGGLALLTSCSDVRGSEAPPTPSVPPATVSCPIEAPIEALTPQPCVRPIMDPCPACGRG